MAIALYMDVHVPQAIASQLLRNIQTAIQEAQVIVRKYIPAGRELSLKLIEERRLDARAE